jgi:hypothetical protein
MAYVHGYDLAEWLLSQRQRVMLPERRREPLQATPRSMPPWPASCRSTASDFASTQRAGSERSAGEAELG